MLPKYKKKAQKLTNVVEFLFAFSLNLDDNTSTLIEKEMKKMQQINEEICKILFSKDENDNFIPYIDPKIEKYIIDEFETAAFDSIGSHLCHATVSHLQINLGLIIKQLKKMPKLYDFQNKELKKIITRHCIHKYNAECKKVSIPINDTRSIVNGLSIPVIYLPSDARECYEIFMKRQRMVK